MIRILLTTLFFFISSTIFGQTNPFFPDIELETTKDRIINSSTFKRTSHAKVIVFWVTTSRSAIQELNALELKKISWKENYETQIIAIALDRSKQKKKVIPFIKSNNWSFKCYLDPSAKSIMAVKGQDVPLTLILDHTGEIVWRVEGFNSNTITKIQEQLDNMLK